MSQGPTRPPPPPPPFSSAKIPRPEPPPLPSKPASLLPKTACEECNQSDEAIFYCVYCDGHFCNPCWDKERAHGPNKLGPDGLPHEKADPQVVNRLKVTFAPPSKPEEQEKLHQEDENTTWFGVAREADDLCTFQDYGRYATLMANGNTGDGPRYPQLVSFIGLTGHGKSTLIKILIEQKRRSNAEDARSFPAPVVGSASNDSTPTTGDVHLYADPSTYFGERPMLFADCEGLEGGEKDPIGVLHRTADKNQHQQIRPTTPADSDGKKLKKKIRLIASTHRRELAWARTSEMKKRQFAVTELYPRLLYTFSDVIVFVLNNPKTFESTVISKLLGWAKASMEKSLNQPTLPHAVILLNASDMGIDPQEWDVDYATNKLLSVVAAAIDRDPAYKEHATDWIAKGKNINTMKDLLECYYSSVRVVRIPRKGRYMLVDEQVSKLYQVLTNRCEHSFFAKKRARMLSNSDELHLHLQSAFDLFSSRLDVPYNFIEQVMKNNPIPQDFGGNITKLAVAIRHQNPSWSGKQIFRELSTMVVSAIVLDCVRHRRKGSADHLLKKFYMRYCLFALDDFCGHFWPCEFFSDRRGPCVNTQDGHAKNHQNVRGNVIAVGQYSASFTVLSYEAEWLKLLHDKMLIYQADISETESDTRIGEAAATTQMHQDSIQRFYRQIGGARKYMSHSVCLCCLREMPEHPLPCGHVLCWVCVNAYGSPRGSSGNVLEMARCPLHPIEAFNLHRPWIVRKKPPSAGIRILTLDGGGIRGIVELQALKELEQHLGGKIPIRYFFDLIVGTSTGGIIALGLGVMRWPIDQCIDLFIRLSGQAFTPRLFKGVGGSLSTKYKNKPFEEALRQCFGDSNLFGGEHESASDYHTKVAVTSCTGTGEQAVVLSNYNRQSHNDISYAFVRPDDPSDELTTWQAARATSAAPTYFKPFVNRKTNQEYLDGALFNNNPARVAHLESKLLWPDAMDRHPDILLSLGTGHNGTDTPGSAERPELRQQPLRATGNLMNAPKLTHRRSGLGQWLKAAPFGSLLNIMVRRVENILNAEQMWQDFRSSVLNTGEAGLSRRYLRINPLLGYRPPDLDKKHEMPKLQQTARARFNDPNYQQRFAMIAHRLVAATFYFDKGKSVKQDNGYMVTGRFRCRFVSEHLRNLGKHLLRFQTTTFQPYFEIFEIHRPARPKRLLLTPEIISDMINSAKFELGPQNILVSEKMGLVNIAFVLQDVGYSRREERAPISGFPRLLTITDRPGSATHLTSDRKHLDIGIGSIKGRSTTRLSYSNIDMEERINRLNGNIDDISPVTSDSARIKTSRNPAAYPESADTVNDWAQRRASASPWTSSAPLPGSSSSSQTSSSHGTSHSISREPIYELDGGETYAASAELPRYTLHDGPTLLDDDEDEEDAAQLRQAIALSLEQQRQEQNHRPPAETSEDQQLAVALMRSRLDFGGLSPQGSDLRRSRYM